MDLQTPSVFYFGLEKKADCLSASFTSQPKPASSHSSVTDWIDQLRNGESSACEKLWIFFLARLTSMIAKRLETANNGVSDEEDVLIDTCEVCFRKIHEGKYPNIQSRDDFWKLLTKIAERKAIDQIRWTRKGVDQHRLDPYVVGLDDGEVGSSLIDSTPGSEPTPEFAAMVADESRYQLSRLEPKLAEVVQLRMMGFKIREIAIETQRSVPTVERYLKLVKEIWCKNDEPSN